MTRRLTYILLLAVRLCCTEAKAGTAAEAKAAEAKADRADSLLRAFDRAESVAAANAFFRQLDAEQFTDAPIRFTDRAPRDTLRQQVWYWAAERYYDRQQYAEAEAYALRALPLCRVGHDRVIEGDCLSLLSLIYVRQGDFERAARYAKLTNELDMKLGDAGNIASSLNTLAGIYMSARQPQEAEKYIRRALQYAEQAGGQQRLAVLLGMASEVYMKLGRAEESLSYATRAYDLERQLGRQDKAAVRQAQRASALISLSRYAEAKAALLKAIPQLRQAQNRHSLGIACNQMGLLLHRERRDTSAVRYLDEALQIFTDQHDLYNESQTRRALYDALRQTDPTQAMLHNDRYNALRDSLYDHETGLLLSQYAAEYDYDTLQASLDRAQRRQRLTLILGAALLLALALLGGVLYWLHVRRRRRAATAAKTTTEEELADVLGKQDRDFILRLAEAVDNAIDRHDTSVEAIAEALNMSLTTLRRRIVEATGDSPKTVISTIQMQKACILLTNHPEYTVAEVAMRTGFDETANFTRAFKRTFGLTPTQFARGEQQEVRG